MPTSRDFLPTVLLAGLLVACQRGAQPDDPETIPGPTATTAPARGAQAGFNPLTGLPLAGSADRQVIVVKVDNAPEAQPQIGLGEAELIQELPVEGGLTRFNAFYYQAAPQLVGPVRSARPTDAELLAPFQPVLAVSGGVDFVLRELQAAGVTVVDEVTLSGAFQRLERPMPYNLMASFDIVAQQGGGVPPAGEPYPFGEGEFSGRPASRVAIPFSAATDLEYQYQEDQGGYLRLENGEPFTALPTFEAQPEPLILDTVVVQVVAQRSSGYTDASGSEVPTLDVIGFGPALIFHQGQVLEGEWRRAAQADGTLFFDEAGRALQLPPGRLIVELVPREVDVSWE